MANTFLNRNEDLKALEEIYQRPGAQLAIVYGRRRVGKTRLLLRFTEGKPHVFYTGIKKTETQQALEFSEEIEKLLGHATPVLFANWRDAIGYAFESCVGRQEKAVVVIDEFPEVQEENRSVPGEISSRLDRYSTEANLMLVLCGSAVRQMEQLLEGREPLYLRQSLTLRLRPFGFEQASLFMDGWDFTKRVEAYAVIGGMPMYLSEAAQHRDVKEFLAEKVINPRGLFFTEGLTIVGQELGDVPLLFGLLEAIAGGAGKLSEISSAVGKKSVDLSARLKRLQAVDLVKREVPATEDKPEKSKRGRYVIKDNFIRSWFRFVYPYSGLIDAGMHAEVMRKVDTDLSTFIGQPVEDIVRQAVAKESARGKLPILLSRVGRYWDKASDIDICGAGTEGEYLWGECKWRNRKIGVDVYYALKEKVRNTRINVDGVNLYLLCSKSGFSDKLREVADAEGVILWDADRLERTLSE